MSRPYKIDWIANNTTFLGVLQAPTINVPLVYLKPEHANVDLTGTLPTILVSTEIGLMPKDNVRKVSLTSAGNLSAINFTITGINEAGLFLTEVLGGPNATTVDSVNAYYKVYNIVPSATSATTVSIGIADGYTMPYQGDYWNQASVMSFQITKVVGTVSLTPQMTDDESGEMVNTFYVPQVQTYAALPPDQATVVPPLTANTMFSFRNFPIAASRILVGATTTGTFTLTTLMQGGHY